MPSNVTHYPRTSSHIAHACLNLKQFLSNYHMLGLLRKLICEFALVRDPPLHLTLKTVPCIRLSLGSFCY